MSRNLWRRPGKVSIFLDPAHPERDGGGEGRERECSEDEKRQRESNLKGKWRVATVFKEWQEWQNIGGGGGTWSQLPHREADVKGTSTFFHIFRKDRFDCASCRPHRLRSKEGFLPLSLLISLFSPFTLPVSHLSFSPLFSSSLSSPSYPVECLLIDKSPVVSVFRISCVAFNKIFSNASSPSPGKRTRGKKRVTSCGVSENSVHKVPEDRSPIDFCRRKKKSVLSLSIFCSLRGKLMPFLRPFCRAPSRRTFYVRSFPPLNPTLPRPNNGINTL